MSNLYILIIEGKKQMVLLANLNPGHREQSGCVICASPRSVTLTRRCSKSPRTRPTDPSSRKSSPPSLTSSSPTLVATWYRGSTARNYVIPRSILWKHKLINLHIRGAFFAFVLKILSEGIIFRWKCGTCTWSRSRSRRSPSTSTCAPSCAASMRTTASSTSSSAAGMGPTLLSWPAATTISLGGCWTWRSSFHLGSLPNISVWTSSNSD